MFVPAVSQQANIVSTAIQYHFCLDQLLCKIIIYKYGYFTTLVELYEKIEKKTDICATRHTTLVLKDGISLS